jgi:sarcosine oxidase subunit alpha
MKRPLFRIKPYSTHSFSGHQLDRSRRLTFTLNGHKLRAYRGDSVLSAALANGFFTAGTHDDSPLALDESLGLCVRFASEPDAPASALPMARTPVVEGANLVIYGAGRPGAFASLARRRATSLKVNFNDYSCVPAPLSEVPVSQRPEVDILVIGGGIAGMAAAIEAAGSGQSVMLVERRGYLGGDALMFGHADGEEDPQAIVYRLSDKIEKLKNVTVLKHAEAFFVEGDAVRIHCVELRDNRPTAIGLAVRAMKTIIATGCGDKQPIFPGNRLPAVSHLGETWHLAHAYAVWRGQKTLVFTSTNVAYRFATQMLDAGGDILKIIDGRGSPSSRFVEIAKASGIKVETGVKIHSAAQPDRSDALIVDTELVWEGLSHAEPLRPDHLIISNGWLPRLNLWRQFGGSVELDEDKTAIAAGSIEDVKLAGSCAGFKGHAAVELSAVNAVREALSQKIATITDEQIDPSYETPDGPLNINTRGDDVESDPAYLSAGSTLVARSQTVRKSLFSRLLNRRAKIIPQKVGDRALGYADTLAMVVLGWLPENQLENVLRERAVVPRIFFGKPQSEGLDQSASEAANPVPDFLLGRFGDAPQTWMISAANAPVELGNLLFIDRDLRDPMEAVGVVVRGGGKNDEPMALIGDRLVSEGMTLVARGGAGERVVSIVKKTG